MFNWNMQKKIKMHKDILKLLQNKTQQHIYKKIYFYSTFLKQLRGIKYTNNMLL